MRSSGEAWVRGRRYELGWGEEAWRGAIARPFRATGIWIVRRTQGRALGFLSAAFQAFKAVGVARRLDEAAWSRDGVM